MSIQVNISVSF